MLSFQSFKISALTCNIVIVFYIVPFEVQANHCKPAVAKVLASAYWHIDSSFMSCYFKSGPNNCKPPVAKVRRLAVRFAEDVGDWLFRWKNYTFQWPMINKIKSGSNLPIYKRSYIQSTLANSYQFLPSHIVRTLRADATKAIIKVLSHQRTPL